MLYPISFLLFTEDQNAVAHCIQLSAELHPFPVSWEEPLTMSDLRPIIANASLRLCFVLFLRTDFTEVSFPSNASLKALGTDYIFVREKQMSPCPVLQHPGICMMTIQR